MPGLHHFVNYCLTSWLLILLVIPIAALARTTDVCSGSPGLGPTPLCTKGDDASELCVPSTPHSECGPCGPWSLRHGTADGLSWWLRSNLDDGFGRTASVRVGNCQWTEPKPGLLRRSQLVQLGDDFARVTDTVSVSTLQREGTSVRTAVTVTSEISSNSTQCWSAGIATEFDLNVPADYPHAATPSTFWLPRSGANASGMVWTDVLQPLSSGRILSQLGDGYVLNDPWGSQREISPIPLATFGWEERDFGVAVMHGLSDQTMAATMDVNVTRSLYSRLYHRLGCQAAPVEFATTIVITEVFSDGGWRDALGSMFAWQPSYFTPEVGAEAMANVGLGAYTCTDRSNLNVSQAVDVFGLTHIWDAHFWWPYIGMFLPPAATTGDVWTSDVDPDQPNCGRYHHGSSVSTAEMASNYVQMQDANITVLAYFNLFEFGRDIQWPLPHPQSPPPEDDWRNASHYISNRLSDGIIANGTQPYYTWQNAIVMDTGSEAYRGHLLSQAKRFLSSFGSLLRGFAIDRLDHTSKFNPAGDDSVSWCGVPCRSQFLAFQRTSQLLKAVLKMEDNAASPRVMTANFNQAARVDLLEPYDGIFSENADESEAFKNLMGLASLGMPALEWTYSPTQILSSPGGGDAWFQQRLYMNVMPFAPVFGSDHSINASTSATNKLSRDYGEMLRQSRGLRWWFKAGAVTILSPAHHQGGPLVNAFVSLDSRCIVVVAVLASNTTSSAEISIAEPPVPISHCLVFHPGLSPPSDLGASIPAVVSVPLVRGSALVRCCSNS